MAASFLATEELVPLAHPERINEYADGSLAGKVTEIGPIGSQVEAFAAGLGKIVMLGKTSAAVYHYAMYSVLMFVYIFGCADFFVPAQCALLAVCTVHI